MKKLLILSLFFFVSGCSRWQKQVDMTYDQAYQIFSEQIKNDIIFNSFDESEGNIQENIEIHLLGNKEYYADILLQNLFDATKKISLFQLQGDISLEENNKKLSFSWNIDNICNEKDCFLKTEHLYVDMGLWNIENELIQKIAETYKSTRIKQASGENLLSAQSLYLQTKNIKNIKNLLFSNNLFDNKWKTEYKWKIAYKIQTWANVWYLVIENANSVSIYLPKIWLYYSKNWGKREINEEKTKTKTILSRKTDKKIRIDVRQDIYGKNTINGYINIYPVSEGERKKLLIKWAGYVLDAFWYKSSKRIKITITWKYNVQNSWAISLILPTKYMLLEQILGDSFSLSWLKR